MGFGYIEKGLSCLHQREATSVFKRGQEGEVVQCSEFVTLCAAVTNLGCSISLLGHISQAAGAITKSSTVKHCFHLLLEQDVVLAGESAMLSTRQLTASYMWP